MTKTTVLLILHPETDKMTTKHNNNNNTLVMHFTFKQSQSATGKATAKKRKQ